MISHQNCEVIVSVLFFYVVKIFCSLVVWRRGMFKQTTLSSIPEKNEDEGERMSHKWVPKKKHEVLKAKYKCLKKLFQVYDASVIGILPESCEVEGYLDQELKTSRRRKKRSHRTKTDACAGTSELSSGDVSLPLDTDKETIATAVIRDLKVTHSSWTSTQFETPAPNDRIQETNENAAEEVADETKQQHTMPYLIVNEKRRPTRFQCFIQRIFGIRHEQSHKNYVLPNGHVYALSDNNISHEGCEKRRRKGLRLRRIRRPKKIQSEIVLRDARSPMILTFVQSVQRNCLRDTTPRQCPINGCSMMSYGIINYNDHLNLCHFDDRKYNCHYCHAGFGAERDKLVHENEHIGISKLNSHTSALTTGRSASKQAANTQTDPDVYVQEEKLKKIVSFFDKIADPESMVNEINKTRCSESNLQTSKSDSIETSEETSESDKRTVSCMHIPRKTDKGKSESSGESGVTSSNAYHRPPIACHFCGEHFNYRRQLSLHVDLEHRIHGKFSKFHSCAGIVSCRTPKRVDMISEDGRINVQSVDRRCGIHRVHTSSTLTQETLDSGVARTKSEESLSCDPSTYMIYNTSVDSTKKRSTVNNIMRRVKSGITSYKWEPGTKIIRV